MNIIRELRKKAGIGQKELADIVGVSIPAELNRFIRANFADYIENFIEFQKIISGDDDSPIVDFGSFMEGYSE